MLATIEDIDNDDTFPESRVYLTMSAVDTGRLAVAVNRLDELFETLLEPGAPSLAGLVEARSRCWTIAALSAKSF